ncbi:hypothetical protein A3197_05550 [Candidatus Thiodiazotropha endoloripes]|nr:hypothetical protein A3197_05550 [Candidatus Thiodiazotropha endoloripes]
MTHVLSPIHSHRLLLRKGNMSLIDFIPMLQISIKVIMRLLVLSMEPPVALVGHAESNVTNDD